jgi:hypothetical protein
MQLLFSTLLSSSAPCLIQPAWAQTDFYNLDKERPLRGEDAFATKRYAWEFQASPLRLTGQRDRETIYEPSIELKYGVLPGIELSLGGIYSVASRFVNQNEGRTEAGPLILEPSILANLNTQTRTLPASAVRVVAHVPLSGLEDPEYEFRGILTRHIVGPVRAHLNGAWIAGNDPDERWWTGLILDYAMPFQHTLLLMETYFAESEAVNRVHSALGFRQQISPTWLWDGSVGRTWTGTGPLWQLNLGFSHEFGIRALMPTGKNPATRQP